MQKIVKTLVITGVIFLFANLLFALQLPKWFLFDAQKALDEWEEKLFKGKVLYSISGRQADEFLLAKSDRSASGIFYRIEIDAKANPIFRWKWKVIKFPEKKTDTKVKNSWIEQDDYAARFYVIFPGLSFLGTTCLEYVWDEFIPEGTIMTSPYFKNIKILVIESGNTNLHKWVAVERNIYDDYKKAFGRPPARKIRAIALMTDTDNTLSSAEAAYDDIEIGGELNNQENNNGSK